MRKLLNRQTQHLLFLLGVTLLASGCGPIGSPLEAPSTIPLQTRAMDSSLTGAATDLYDPIHGSSHLTNYTLSGNQRQINKLQQQILPFKNDQYSSSISSVDVQFLNKQFKASNSPELLKVNVKLEGQYSDEIEFLGELTGDNNKGFKKAHGINTNSSGELKYSLDALCENKECSYITLVFNQYSKEIKDENLLAKAGVTFSLSTPSVEIERSLDFGEHSTNKSLEELAHLDLKSITPSKSTVVILGGKSYSNVRIIDNNSLKPIVDFSTPLTETNESTAFLDPSKSSLSSDLSIELVGNDPNSGSIAVDISRWNNHIVDPDKLGKTHLKPLTPQKDSNLNTSEFANKHRAEGVRLYLVDSPINIEPPKSSDILLLGNSETSGIFPLPKNAPQNSNTNTVTQAIISRYNPYKGELARVVKIVQGLEKDKFCKNSSGQYTMTRGFSFPSRAQVFFNNVQNISPHMSQEFSKLDVTPKIGNLLLMESNSLSSTMPQNLNIVGTSGEVGPFQIMPSTARYIDQTLLTSSKMNLYGLTSGKPNIYDDRQYLIPASKMAGAYMKQLFSQFKDPGMAIMSYNRGAGNVSRDERKAESRTEKFDNTLDKIVQYNMFSRDAKRCSALHYAYTFLAMYFISENPEEFGFKIDNSVKLKQETINRLLYNPKK